MSRRHRMRKDARTTADMRTAELTEQMVDFGRQTLIANGVVPLDNGAVVLISDPSVDVLHPDVRPAATPQERLIAQDLGRSRSAAGKHVQFLEPKA